LEYRELGSTGEMAPEIGLGTWKYRGGSEPLQKGIELGAYLIDTAEMYKTEDAVGSLSKTIATRSFSQPRGWAATSATTKCLELLKKAYVC